MLGEVVTGPARGRPLALHLDFALPVDVQRAIVGLDVVQRKPHVTLSLNYSSWQPQEEERAAVLPRGSSSTMLHVVLWVTPRPELLKALWFHWKPRNLLLFSLGLSLGTDVMRDEALSGVKKLALIGYLMTKTNRGPDVLGVYTMLPFSSRPVQLLGPWERESFSSWEALFPDRFPSFEGYTFHLAPYIDYPPYIYRPFAEEAASTTTKYGRGVAIEMTEAISKKLNYTYTITETVGKWGAIENGSWSGILGTMERKETNFTINGYYLNEDRASGFDPSVTVWSESSSVFVPSPNPLPEWLSIIRPFSPSAWTSFVAVIVIAVVSMAFMVSVLVWFVSHLLHPDQI